MGKMMKTREHKNELTMQEAFERFLEHGKSSWAPSTLQFYQKNVGYFLRFLSETYPAGLTPGNLPPSVFLEYLVSLRAKERYSNHPLRDVMHVEGTIKNNTVRTYGRAAKVFLNWCYQNRLCSQRLTDYVRMPKPDPEQILPLSATEAEAMDAAFDPHIPNDLRNLCILHLMLDAGLRSCEVIRLQAADVVFSSGYIAINRSKHSRSRVVRMVPRLERLLSEYVHVFRIASGDGPFFRKCRSRDPIDSNVIRALFIRIRRSTGLDRIYPHLLRHTFATSYIMGGGNLESLRILLGHYDYSVTRIYLHLADQFFVMDADIYRLDPVLFKTGYTPKRG